MHSKLSMKPVERAHLSDHELKRCRALARGQRWQVFEEDIVWWSLDRSGWLPVEDSLWPHRRRWLLVETEEGVAPALIWLVGHGLGLPTLSLPEDALEEAPDLAEID